MTDPERDLLLLIAEAVLSNVRQEAGGEWNYRVLQMEDAIARIELEEEARRAIMWQAKKDAAEQLAQDAADL